LIDAVKEHPEMKERFFHQVIRDVLVKKLMGTHFYESLRHERQVHRGVKLVLAAIQKQPLDQITTRILGHFLVRKLLHHIKNNPDQGYHLVAKLLARFLKQKFESHPDFRRMVEERFGGMRSFHRFLRRKISLIIGHVQEGRHLPHKIRRYLEKQLTQNLVDFVKLHPSKGKHLVKKIVRFYIEKLRHLVNFRAFRHPLLRRLTRYAIHRTIQESLHQMHPAEVSPRELYFHHEGMD